VTAAALPDAQQSPDAQQNIGRLEIDQARALAMLRTRDRISNVLYLASVWAIIIAAMAAAAAWTHWWVLALAFVAVSTRQQALLNIEHDCIHTSFTRDKRHDVLLGITVCASPCGSPWYATRARHLAHHRLITTADDPDLPLHDTADKATKGALARYFGLGLLGGYAVMVLLKGPPSTVDRAARLRDLRNLGLAQGVLWAATWLAFDWWIYPLLWVLPLVTLTTVCHLIRSFIEHAVLTEERPQHDNLLISITSNPFERAMVAPFNMNFHAEHHLYPAVPARRLPELRRALAATPEPPRLLRTAYVTVLVRYARSLP
jgi:fatty acid desaturase